MTYKNHDRCRVCNNENLIPYLDLGLMPLSNNLATSATDSIHNQRYPLKVLFCDHCGLSQLSIVIPAESMFSNYVYRSSISKGFLDHCHDMAIELRDKYELNADSFHVDIAGNDGALLDQFRKVLGHQVLNVDPAQNMKAICEAARIPIFSEFWGHLAARRVLNRGWGPSSKSTAVEAPDPRADLVTATNVFAHVDDVRSFLDAVKLILKRTGVLVLEFPYLIDFLENNEFDTVYFEHLSYFSIYPLRLLCHQVGLNLMSVSHQKIHGGSVRVEIGFGPEDETVDTYMIKERQDYAKVDKYHEFAADVHRSIREFAYELRQLPTGQVAGFAASAKGNTLLNCAMVNPATMRYIVDETPEKIGKWSPGVRLPIVSMLDMMRTPPEYLVILSWNFAEEIMAKCRAAGYVGKFILPIPEFKILA